MRVVNVAVRSCAALFSATRCSTFSSRSTRLNAYTPAPFST
ncbi:Uncharacterised protein [Mycobacteroides abscessus]|nr:Uncharacterised protein [Mycobacteroides abscessus]